ncbi:UDP-GlcNAc:betaGal beta-1,3-N-acetylglucosaminyltransferase 8 [Tachyglossus aculeatus]|uniref:UDP-GlcNAc:betaGal beta-1,3-N-acetylglucosaminyltransferase 8 n=1 Tax=Tachyglossus aculeatus TaxID=9261 RepID=UPI0018F5E4F3|nr:UDP-GlcNAc:betaGal beta-1,3-N-acetylglucosaminyltransferase 8 [Tachyglossus aculeatus]
MRCTKCLLSVAALLPLLALKLYVDWGPEPAPGPPVRRGPPAPGPAPPAEPSLPANLSRRLGQSAPPAAAYWNREQWRLRGLPAGPEAGDCRAWGAAAAAAVPDFASYPEPHRRFLLSAACRDFPLRLQARGGGCGPPGARPPYLLLAVKSAPGRFAQRQAVRETWGREAGGVRRLFLLGSARGEHQPDLGPLVGRESRRHGDLLLWDFQDVAFNRTLKDLLFLGWLARRCPRVPFVLRAEDDAFVHVEALLGLLRGLDPARARTLYLGQVFARAAPFRSPGSPYYVPESFYAGGYPAYAGGGGYVFAGRLGPWLLRAAARVAPFPIEDVYAGLCFRALGLEPRAHPGFRTDDAGLAEAQQDDPCAHRRLLLVRPRGPRQTLRLWRGMRDPALRC